MFSFFAKNKSRLNFISGKKGFSLIEIMFAMGLVSIIGLAVATLSTDMMKNQRKNQVLNEFNAKVNELSQLLSGSNTCSTMLRPAFNSTNWGLMQSANGYSVPSLKIGGSTIIQANQNIGPLKISSIILKEAGEPNGGQVTVINGIDHKLYRLELTVNTDNADPKLGKVGQRSKTFGLIGSVTLASKELTGCYDESVNSGTLDAACKMLGGVYTPAVQGMSAKCSALDSLNQVTQQLTADVGVLNTQVAVLQGETSDLRTRLASAEGRIQALEQEIANIKSAIQGITNQLTSHQSQIDDLRQRIQQLRTELTQAQTQIANLITQLQQLANQQQLLDNRLTAVENSLNNLTAQLNNLSTNMQNAINNLQTSYSSLNSQIDNINNSIANANTRISNLENLNTSIANFLTNLASADCSSPQVVTGISASGTVTCATRLAAASTCPNGQVVTGIGSNGQAVCGNIPASASPQSVYRCPADSCDNNSASMCTGQVSFNATCACRADGSVVRNCTYLGKLYVTP